MSQSSDDDYWRHYEARFSGICSAIASWDRVVWRGTPSAIKTAYASSIGWDWLAELKQKRAHFVLLRLQMAKTLAGRGMHVARLAEYERRAATPLAD
jgi:hypothetical protein